MSWNYRVTKNAQGYAIREVYYDEFSNEDGTFTPVRAFTDPITGYWESITELMEDLNMMSCAALAPTLEVSDE